MMRTASVNYEAFCRGWRSQESRKFHALREANPEKYEHYKKLAAEEKFRAKVARAVCLADQQGFEVRRVPDTEVQAEVQDFPEDAGPHQEEQEPQEPQAQEFPEDALLPHMVAAGVTTPLVKLENGILAHRPPNPMDQLTMTCKLCNQEEDHLPALPLCGMGCLRRGGDPTTLAVYTTKQEEKGEVPIDAELHEEVFNRKWHSTAHCEVNGTETFSRVAADKGGVPKRVSYDHPCPEGLCLCEPVRLHILRKEIQNTIIRHVKSVTKSPTTVALQWLFICVKRCAVGEIPEVGHILSVDHCNFQSGPNPAVATMTYWEVDEAATEAMKSAEDPVVVINPSRYPFKPQQGVREMNLGTFGALEHTVDIDLAIKLLEPFVGICRGELETMDIKFEFQRIETTPCHRAGPAGEMDRREWREHNNHEPSLLAALRPPEEEAFLFDAADAAGVPLGQQDLLAEWLEEMMDGCSEDGGSDGDAASSSDGDAVAGDLFQDYSPIPGVTWSLRCFQGSRVPWIQGSRDP